VAPAPAPAPVGFFGKLFGFLFGKSESAPAANAPEVTEEKLPNAIVAATPVSPSNNATATAVVVTATNAKSALLVALKRENGESRKH
jgi:hypothetical protein